jgi:hypothetical protein
MPDTTSGLRLLANSRANLGVDAGRLSFTAEPLFKSISAARTQRGVTAAATWHLLKLNGERGVPAAIETANPWDVCHQLMIDGGDQIEFAESDLQQPARRNCADQLPLAPKRYSAEGRFLKRSVNIRRHWRGSLANRHLQRIKQRLGIELTLINGRRRGAALEQDLDRFPRRAGQSIR